MLLVSNLPYGQRAAPLATIYDLGGTSCVPGGSALRAPTPHDTAFTGPRFGGISYEQQASPLAAFSDPPANILPRITPRPFSLAPMGFIHDDGTSFMSPYLTPLASQPGTTPSRPYGHHSVLLAAIYNLGGTSYVPGGSALRPPPPMTLLLRGLTAQIQKRIFLLGCTYAMGLNWQPFTLHFSMGGALALHLHPQAAPRFRPFGVIMGGLHSPHLLLLIIMGGLQPPPLFLLIIVVGLPSLPLPLGLCGPRQDPCISHRFWGALLLRPFLRLSPVRSRIIHHWW